MTIPLFHVVKAAVIAVTARVRPSQDTRRKSAIRWLDDLDDEQREATLKTMSHGFEQRSEFNSQMHGLLEDSSRELDIASTKLQVLRAQVVSMRRQLDTSQNATESTWDEVKASLKKGHSEIRDGLRNARTWPHAGADR